MAGFPPAQKMAPVAPNADHKTPQPKAAKHKPMPANVPQGAHSTGYVPKKGPPAMPAKVMPQGSMPGMPMVAAPDPAMIAKMKASLKSKRKAM